MKYTLVNSDIRTDYVRNLLKDRGITNFDIFVNPDKSCIQDPTDLDNMENGRRVLVKAIEKGGNITILCDSDTDGFTSATIAGQSIKERWPSVKISYIIHEGKQHGLSDVITEILDSDKECDLVVCPDSSSNDYEYHEMLKEKGIPVLVLDHHITDLQISDNATIINNQLSQKYLNKELTGAGVVYQFCRYLDSFYNTNYADYYMDLAALGIVGDMGSMLEPENQFIIQTGFKEENIHNFFLKTLIDKQSYSMQNKINPTTIAFYVVPLINAMIRVGTQEEKLRLLHAFVNGTDEVVSHKRGANGAMEKVAIESARECGNAKSAQNRIKDRVVAILMEKILKKGLLDNKILFIRLEDDDDFPAELNGLVAMKLSAEFKRPTIVARLNKEGYDRGSIRGLNDSEFNKFKSFLTESGYFEYVMGHENAAGASILDKNLKAFHEYANEKLKNVDFGENAYEINFDRFASDGDLEDIIFDIGQFENIWGQKNSVPLIHVGHINLAKNEIQIIGSKKDTLKFVKNGITYIKFRATDLIHELDCFEGPIQMEVVGTASVNEWGGRVTPQILITDCDIVENICSF